MSFSCYFSSDLVDLTCFFLEILVVDDDTFSHAGVVRAVFKRVWKGFGICVIHSMICEVWSPEKQNIWVIYDSRVTTDHFGQYVVI